MPLYVFHGIASRNKFKRFPKVGGLEGIIAIKARNAENQAAYSASSIEIYEVFSNL